MAAIAAQEITFEMSEREIMAFYDPDIEMGHNSDVSNYLYARLSAFMEHCTDLEELTEIYEHIREPDCSDMEPSAEDYIAYCRHIDNIKEEAEHYQDAAPGAVGLLNVIPRDIILYIRRCERVWFITKCREINQIIHQLSFGHLVWYYYMQPIVGREQLVTKLSEMNDHNDFIYPDAYNIIRNNIAHIRYNDDNLRAHLVAYMNYLAELDIRRHQEQYVIEEVGEEDADDAIAYFAPDNVDDADREEERAPDNIDDIEGDAKDIPIDNVPDLQALERRRKRYNNIMDFIMPLSGIFGHLIEIDFEAL
jgi:hypothetical protein